MDSEKEVNDRIVDNDAVCRPQASILGDPMMYK